MPGLRGKAESPAPGMLQLSTLWLAWSRPHWHLYLYFFNFLTVYPCCWAWATHFSLCFPSPRSKR